MTETLASRPEVREVSQEVETIVSGFSGYAITTREEFVASGEDLRRLKSAAIKLEEREREITEPLRAALESARDLFRPMKAKIASAEASVKRELARFRDEEEKRRREEQRKADEEARRQRAEKERAAEEARRKAEETAAKARAEAEKLRAEGAKAEAERVEEKAAETVQRGEAKAAAIADQAAAIVAPVIAREAAPKVGGVSFRETWNFAIEDPAKLPREYLKPDEAAIRSVVRGLKGATSIPGVRVFREVTTVAKGA